MTPFDWHKLSYPRTWSDMSFDFRLMFAWHGSMIVLAIAGRALSLDIAMSLAAILAVGIALLALRYRRAVDWHWPGARLRDVASAVFYAIAIGFFMYVAIPFPPANASMLAILFAGAGIGAYAVLQALNVTRPAKVDFLADCGPRVPLAAAAVTPGEALWRRIVRILFTVVFILVWAEAVVSFYFLNRALRTGVLVPTVDRSAPINDHGTMVYVTTEEKGRIDLLQTITMTGIPAVMVCGLVLHFIVGVRLFSNFPPRRPRQ